MTDSHRRFCSVPCPTLTADDRALLRPMILKMLTAFRRWGLEDDEPTPPNTDAEADDFMLWMWARPLDRPSMQAAIAELKNEPLAG